VTRESVEEVFRGSKPSELFLQICAQIGRCGAHFVYQSRPAVDDCDDIFKIAG